MTVRQEIAQRLALGLRVRGLSIEAQAEMDALRQP